MAKRNEINTLCGKLSQLSSSTTCATLLWDNYVEISKILEKIKQLEEMKIESPKRTQGIEKFMVWLREHGANVDKTSIAEFPEYDLGLKAECDLVENQLILDIPRRLIFNTQSAAPELNALQNDPLIQHVPQVALAIALLIERFKENSKWKPYLDILPTTYNTVLYMTAEEMIMLKGSPTLEPALRLCRNIARQYSYFSRIFQNNNNAVSAILRDVFTYERYCWAVSTIMTRQNLIPSEDGTRMILALIPMWDICNHENGRITTDFNDTTERCECYAQRDFKKGEQIFIHYGPRTNSEFFVHSGFVYSKNLNDAFKLRLGISKADSLRKERIELLRKLHIPPLGEFLIKSSTKPIQDLLLAFLRVFSMRKSDLTHWLRSDRVHDLKHEDCVLDPVVVENVRNFMIARIRLLLNNYPTKFEEDIPLLLSPDALPERKRLAVELRCTEKQILYGALAYVGRDMKPLGTEDYM